MFRTYLEAQFGIRGTHRRRYIYDILEFISTLREIFVMANEEAKLDTKFTQLRLAALLKNRENN